MYQKCIKKKEVKTGDDLPSKSYTVCLIKLKNKIKNDMNKKNCSKNLKFPEFHSRCVSVAHLNILPIYT